MSNSKRTNPFLRPYDTPFGVPPFGAIELSDYEPAIRAGIEREDAEIAAITGNAEPPTFANTIEALDASGRLLERVTTVMGNLHSAETSPALDELCNQMTPLLSQHESDLMLNEALFARIKAVHDAPPSNLTPEQTTLLNETYDSFRRSGAALSASDKERLRKLKEEGALLVLKFEQNLLSETNAFKLHLTDEAQLDGLPEAQREQAAATAKELGLTGWVFTLKAPSYGPFMTHSTQRELRRRLYMASATRCATGGEHDNREICRRLVNLRGEMARLLGYDTFADMVLAHRMAETTERVYKLLNDLVAAYRPHAEAERDELLAYARRLEGDDFELKPWDVAYYSHKLQLERYDIDSEMLRPYFELSRVKQGVFGLATRLYGITFKENPQIPVYHPEVSAYEVHDADNALLGVLLCDFHPRAGKQGGAWETSYRGQWIGGEGNHRPVASVTMNLSRPTPTKPALLSLGEVTTFLHEFGHSLHSLFANTRYRSLSGTNVYWDFVELPSQIMENFAVEKDFLSTFAYHYETGEPLPDDYIRRIRESRNFRVASACLRQVSFGLLDMAYYTLRGPLEGDLIDFEKRAWQAAIITPQRRDTCMTAQFSHIMAGGYSAGYYSYKWAEVLEADAFGEFKRHGLFSREVAERFRHEILEKGGTEHPMTLYKRFRGAEPTLDALLERDGMKQPQP